MRIFTPARMNDVFKLVEREKKIKFLAGGTDLVPLLAELKKEGFSFIDLSHIEGLKYIKIEDNQIKIGALTVFSDLAENIIILKYIPMLAESSARFGSVQIRNMATIGGNIANASPAADSLPVLLALDAGIKVQSGFDEVKTVPINKVISEDGKLLLDNGNLICEIILPLLQPENHFTYFGKIGSRKTVSIARLNAGFLVEFNQKTEEIIDIRIALGALGKKVFRAVEVEKLLSGKVLNKTLEKEFLDLLTETVDKAIPGRYSQPYKRQAIRGIGDDFINEYKKYIR